MNVIGIDISYRSTGIVALDYDSGEIAARQLIVPTLDRTEDNLGANLAEVASRVLAFADAHPGSVFVEQAISHRNGRTTVRIGQMHGAIYAALAGAGHPTPRFWTVAEIKKHATGYGNCGKPQMIDSARRRWGLDLSHDEADAAWCADLGRNLDLATFGTGE